MKGDRLPIWVCWAIGTVWVAMSIAFIWMSSRYISRPYTFNDLGTFAFVIACASAPLAGYVIFLLWRFATVRPWVKAGATGLLSLVVAATFVSAKVEPVIVDGRDLGSTVVGPVVSGPGLVTMLMMLLLSVGKLDALKRPAEITVEAFKA